MFGRIVLHLIFSTIYRCNIVVMVFVDATVAEFAVGMVLGLDILIVWACQDLCLTFT